MMPIDGRPGRSRLCPSTTDPIIPPKSLCISSIPIFICKIYGISDHQSQWHRNPGMLRQCFMISFFFSSTWRYHGHVHALIALIHTYRFYEERFPEVDDVVMVQVRSIAEMGAYVSLLEYGNIEGMILFSELSRRRIRSVQKLIKVGRQEPVMVLRVDKEKGYIDLSKRRVSPEDVAVCHSSTTMNMMMHVCLYKKTYICAEM